MENSHYNIQVCFLNVLARVFSVAFEAERDQISSPNNRHIPHLKIILKVILKIILNLLRTFLRVDQIFGQAQASSKVNQHHFNSTASSVNSFGGAPTPYPPAQYNASHESARHTPQHTRHSSQHTHPHTPASAHHIVPSHARFPSANPTPNIPTVRLTHEGTTHIRRASLPVNQFTPYQRAPVPVKHEHGRGPMDFLANGQGRMPGPESASHAVHGGIGRAASAAPVTSQLANLAINQHNNNHASANPVTPARIAPHTANSDQSNSRQRTLPSAMDTIAIESDSDTHMPSFSDLLRPSAPALPKKESVVANAAVPSKAKPADATETKSGTASKSTRKAKSKNQNAEEKPTSSEWTFEEFKDLVIHITDSDDSFKRSQDKGTNLSFWKRVSDQLFESKKSPESVRAQWKKAERIYPQVKAFESFTGGGGDGEWDVEDDDDEEAAIGKLNNRLAYIRERKPNIDHNKEVKNGAMYRNWTRGGDESLYNAMHIRFKDKKTFEREAPRRSGSISPLETGSESDDETTSKSDANILNRSAKGKSRNAKRTERQARGKSGLESVASTTDKFFAAKQASTEAKQNVALQRLEFERAQADVNNKIALDTLEMRTQNQKRKWSNDQRMAKLQEEETKRRRLLEEKAEQEKRILDRIEKLNGFMRDATNPAVIEMYQKQIDKAFGELPSAE
ncbi:hypothetical protein FRC07_004122 [Ceratobasidium sp. 392]|nr:hypothetical protein FRC07_004122 [Ceratobasidium sp. 392]